MIVLWAMSLWAAMIVLAASGFGAHEFQKYGLSRGRLIGLVMAVWVLGWWTWHGSTIRLNFGYVLLTATGWFGVALLGQRRWWLLTPTLALVALFARILAPFAPEQASVIPAATIESLGLGVAAGITVGGAFPAALVAAAAEGLSGVLVAIRNVGVWDFGRYDMVAVMLATVAAWAVGWVTSGVIQRFSRPA